jgi:catechol 2,3-dioxygenase-like lactoylglutathione lyase family enzyme
MKRFHVHVSVPDLAASIRFYSTLFGTGPAVVKTDYAKWMLEDPRVNFAISERGGKTGINHLGLQTDSDEELEALSGQLQQANLGTQTEREVACCYARSNKYWVTDPTGIAWETFHTLGAVPTFDGHEAESSASAAACCTPASRPVAVSTVGAKMPVKSASACCS